MKGVPAHVVTLVEAWKASGRVAAIYPRRREVSLSGFPALPYAKAVEKMIDVLYPPRAVEHPTRGAIDVKGTGAATYWRDPEDTSSPFGGRWILASPEFRKGIEEAEAKEC